MRKTVVAGLDPPVYAKMPEWRETAVVNFTDTLLVNSALLRFVLAVDLLQG